MRNDWYIIGSAAFEKWARENPTIVNNRDWNGSSKDGRYYFPYKGLLTCLGSEECTTRKLVTLEELIKMVEMETGNTKQEIKGYRCPTDLFGGTIIKGMLFVSKGVYYQAVNGHGQPIYGYTVPKEITEAWEPVYNHTEKIVTLRANGTEYFDVIVSKERNGVHFAEDRTTITVPVIRAEYAKLTSINSIGYILIVNSIDIGCKKNVPMEDVHKLMQAVDEIFPTT